jgi:hypothetical protein
VRITTCFFKLGLVGLGLACAPSALVHAEPQDQAEAKQPAEPRDAEARDAEPGPSAEYWIGVQCSPIDDPALRSQLGLERREGLLVEDVLSDSPAAKAGLQRYDVLLTAGGSRLRDMHMLQRSINSAAGGELKIELYRTGKRQTVTVKPAERGEQSGPASVLGRAPQDALQQWLERRSNLPPQSLYFFGPGVVMQPAPRGLPDDMSVTIVRKGKEPAQVIVKQGDQTWETTEDQLAKLPGPARHEVEKLLPRQMPPPARPEVPTFSGVDGRELTETLDRQRRDLNSQLEQLRKRLEKLEHRQAPPDDLQR